MSKFYLVDYRVVHSSELLFTDDFEEVFPCDYFSEMEHSDLVELWNAFCKTDGGFAHRTIYPNNEGTINIVFKSPYDFARKVTQHDFPYDWDNDWFNLDDWDCLVSYDDPMVGICEASLSDWVYESPDLFLKLINKED